MTKGEQKRGIFVNYRRSDSGPFAGRIFDRLNVGFPGLVFMDTELIQLGEDFVSKIEGEIRACSVVVAIIGKSWSSLLQEIPDYTNDFVAMELRIALEQGKPVVPVLLEGATMPKEESLPLELQPLARRNAIEVGHARSERDVQELARALSFLVGQKPALASLSWPPAARRAWVTAIIAALILVPLTADDPIYWRDLWSYANPFFVIPVLTSALALRWPIPKHWAAAFVIVIQSIVLLLPIPYMLSVATAHGSFINIGLTRLGVAGFVLGIALNVALVMFICARFYRI